MKKNLIWGLRITIFLALLISSLPAMSRLLAALGLGGSSLLSKQAQWFVEKPELAFFLLIGLLAVFATTFFVEKKSIWEATPPRLKKGVEKIINRLLEEF
jgi:hypothetical protein